MKVSYISRDNVYSSKRNYYASSPVSNSSKVSFGGKRVNDRYIAEEFYKDFVKMIDSEADYENNKTVLSYGLDSKSFFTELNRQNETVISNFLLSRNGTAYAAWSAGWPVFVCDLNNTYERYAAQELLRTCDGAVAVVSRPLSAQTRTILARYAPDMAVVTDEAGLLSVLLGNYGTVMLLERRIGGWTVTFPAGGASEKDLKNRKYPGFARALARCAVLPASFPQTKDNLPAEASR